MRRFLDRLYAASGVLAALCLFGILIVMLAQSFGREAGVLLRGADDIVAWLCAASAFLALGATFRHGELVRVGLWLDMLGPRGRRFAELWCLGLTGAFSLYMLWSVASFVYDSWRFHEVAQGLIKLPIWIPQLSFLAGVLIFTISVLDELARVIAHGKPTYQVVEDERRAAGDYSETV